MEILLFDLDGVLLDSAGYHRSLQEAVRQMARGLGFGDKTLSREDIEWLEAFDITAEWDSAAICASLLLAAARRADPSATLPGSPPILPRPDRGLPFPDIQGFLEKLGRTRTDDPIAACRQGLSEHLDGRMPEHAREALAFLDNARDLSSSLTFWLIQLFNLGSERFRAIYGRDPGTETECYLERYDLPTLSEEEHARLRTWLARGEHHAAVVTNRPSASSGPFNFPEAEIGRAKARVGDLPSIAAGDLVPAASARGLDPQAFLKPSPVHILAAMRRALGEGAVEAVEGALSLFDNRSIASSWRRFKGARVCLFEDAPKGLRGAHAAARVLSDRGIDFDLRLFGIAGSAVRSRRLNEAGARTFPHIRDALAFVGTL